MSNATKRPQFEPPAPGIYTLIDVRPRFDPSCFAQPAAAAATPATIKPAASGSINTTQETANMSTPTTDLRPVLTREQFDAKMALFRRKFGDVNAAKWAADGLTLAEAEELHRQANEAVIHQFATRGLGPNLAKVAAGIKLPKH